MRLPRILALMVCALLSRVHAQRDALPPPQFPTSQLSFDKGHVVEGTDASPVMGYPAHCGTDGSIAIEVFRSPDYRTPHIVVVDSQLHARELDLSTVPHLFDVELEELFQSAGTTTMLIRATEDSAVQPSITTHEDGSHVQHTRHTGEHTFFLINQDTRGSWRNPIKIDAAINPLQFGVFENGTILLLGSDVTTRKLELALLDESGTLLKILDPPKSFANSYVHDTQSGGLQFGAGQLVTFGERLLLVQRNSTAPVLVVSASGEVQQVPIRLPDPGLQLDSVFATNQRLYVRFRSVQNDDRGQSKRLFEVNPNDGTLSHRFVMSDNSFDSIACIGTDVVAIHTNEDGTKFVRSVAALAP